MRKVFLAALVAVALGCQSKAPVPPVPVATPAPVVVQPTASSSPVTVPATAVPAPPQPVATAAPAPAPCVPGQVEVTNANGTTGPGPGPIKCRQCDLTGKWGPVIPCPKPKVSPSPVKSPLPPKPKPTACKEGTITGGVGSANGPVCMVCKNGAWVEDLGCK